jgi:hypothetical protein
MNAEPVSVGAAIPSRPEGKVTEVGSRVCPGRNGPRATRVDALGRPQREVLMQKALETDDRLHVIAARFAEHPDVVAVAQGGSRVGTMTDERSDYDVYVYSRRPVDVSFRAASLRPRAARLELHRTFWEDEDCWVESDGTEFEIMYRTCQWTEGELDARLKRFEAALGYTTAVCYNLEQSRPLWDRSGWLAGIQNRLRRGYPAGLAEAIVRKNLPLLNSTISSYEQQIEAAFHREDLVSLNHRVAAWLASYFDILFATNRRYHPGEKRLLAHAARLPSLPESAVQDVSDICMTVTSREHSVTVPLALARTRLETWLAVQGDALRGGADA